MPIFGKMAADEVHVKICQQEIVKLDLQIKAFIQDVYQCSGPLHALQALNKQIRDCVENLKSRILELEKLAKEQDKETDRIALMKNVDNHRKQMSQTLAGLRQANLACHLAIEKKEKDRLLGKVEDSDTLLRQRGKRNKENLAKSAGSVTESLLSLSRMMAGQVEQSQNNVTTLVNSSKQVTDTNEEFKSITSHIQNSKKLLTKYSRREFTDKLLIVLALVFFFATVLYIVKKRLF